MYVPKKNLQHGQHKLYFETADPQKYFALKLESSATDSPSCGRRSRPRPRRDSQGGGDGSTGECPACLAAGGAGWHGDMPPGPSLAAPRRVGGASRGSLPNQAPNVCRGVNTDNFFQKGNMLVKKVVSVILCKIECNLSKLLYNIIRIIH